MIMLNSPHNPTGAILSEEDRKEPRSIVLVPDIYRVG
jgi:aspartate/methionine/tyrosine aminotransferase